MSKTTVCHGSAHVKTDRYRIHCKTTNIFFFFLHSSRLFWEPFVPSTFYMNNTSQIVLALLKEKYLSHPRILLPPSETTLCSVGIHEGASLSSKSVKETTEEIIVYCRTTAFKLSFKSESCRQSVLYF